MKELKPEPESVLMGVLDKVPAISDYAFGNMDSDKMDVRLTFIDGRTVGVSLILLERAFPKMVEDKISSRDMNDGYLIIMAPYISDASADICVKAGIGYCDYSGNCLISLDTLYISSKGNPNRFPVEDRAKTVFNSSAQTTSKILRELLKDISKTWKLKILAETVGCSIGMVHRVKTYLCEQRWAAMDSDGLRLTDPHSLLKEWSKAYSVMNVMSCYTLDSLPVFEEKCSKAHRRGTKVCLTGISGGVRYAPVVRYAKAHVWIRRVDIPSFLQMTGCKEVNSGANVVLYVSTGDDVFADSREINGNCVASPVQVYLDCMQLQGRGEEMAEAVYAKEIQK